MTKDNTDVQMANVLRVTEVLHIGNNRVKSTLKAGLCLFGFVSLALGTVPTGKEKINIC